MQEVVHIDTKEQKNGRRSQFQELVMTTYHLVLDEEEVEQHVSPVHQFCFGDHTDHVDFDEEDDKVQPQGSVVTL